MFITYHLSFEALKRVVVLPADAELWFAKSDEPGVVALIVKTDENGEKNQPLLLRDVVEPAA